MLRLLILSFLVWCYAYSDVTAIREARVINLIEHHVNGFLFALCSTLTKKVKLLVLNAGSEEYGLRKFIMKIKCTFKLENLNISEDPAISKILTTIKILKLHR